MHIVKKNLKSVFIWGFEILILFSINLLAYLVSMFVLLCPLCIGGLFFLSNFSFCNNKCHSFFLSIKCLQSPLPFVSFVQRFCFVFCFGGCGFFPLHRFCKEKVTFLCIVVLQAPAEAKGFLLLLLPHIQLSG
jgi:hypothetical protein